MINAIVYKSQTGHTEQYAKILGKKTNLPVYELNAATKELPRKIEIIYLGWLMAGKVQGYKKAEKRFAVKAVCGVGMSAELAEIEKAYRDFASLYPEIRTAIRIVPARTVNFKRDAEYCMEKYIPGY